MRSHEPDQPTSPSQPASPNAKPPLRYRLNPCDYERHPKLERLGELITKLGSECRCCSGARVLGALVIGFALGALLL